MPRKIKVKDKEAPKKASSSFIHFANEERPKVLTEMGHISAAELGRELGRRWRALGPEIKSKYVKLAKNDRRRYKKEMKNYKPSPPPVAEPPALECVRMKAMEKYFKYLINHWKSVSDLNPKMPPDQVQDMVWRQWISVKNEKQLKESTKREEFRLCHGELLDSPWMSEE